MQVNRETILPYSGIHRSSCGGYIPRANFIIDGNDGGIGITCGGVKPGSLMRNHTGQFTI